MSELEPITREEMFLAKAGGQDVTVPEPITREEMFLNDIVKATTGDELTAGTPITRQEMFLSNVANSILNSGGGGDDSGNSWDLIAVEELGAIKNPSRYNVLKTISIPETATRNYSVIVIITSATDTAEVSPYATVGPHLATAQVYLNTTTDGFGMTLTEVKQLINVFMDRTEVTFRSNILTYTSNTAMRGVYSHPITANGDNYVLEMHGTNNISGSASVLTGTIDGNYTTRVYGLRLAGFDWWHQYQ